MFLFSIFLSAVISKCDFDGRVCGNSSSYSAYIILFISLYMRPSCGIF